MTKHLKATTNQKPHLGRTKFIDYCVLFTRKYILENIVKSMKTKNVEFFMNRGERLKFLSVDSVKEKKSEKIVKNTQAHIFRNDN